MNHQFDFSFLWDPDNAYWRDILYGTWLTVRLTVPAVALGLACAIGSTSRVRAPSRHRGHTAAVSAPR